MHCCTSSAAREEALIPWTRDPSGRPQSQQKSEIRRTTDLPCHASTIRIRARSGKTGSSSISRQLQRLQGRTFVWSSRLGWSVAPIALLQLAAFPDPIAKSQRPDASASNGAQRSLQVQKNGLLGNGRYWRRKAAAHTQTASRGHEDRVERYPTGNDKVKPCQSA
jgi:hypothetical protein